MTMTHHALIRWATNILSREMQAGLYGCISFKFENGKITSVKTEKNERPDFTEN